MAWELIKAVYTDKKFIKVTQLRVKNNDTFLLQGLYNTMHDWLGDSGWQAESNTKIEETLFRKVEHASGAKDFRIQWRLKKNINAYIRYLIDIDFNILRIQDVEVIHQGKKIKSNKCDCDINMVIRMEYDYGGEWSKHWLLKHMATVFPKRIYWQEFEQHRKNAYWESYKFMEIIKDFWKMKRWISEPEKGSFERPLGLPDYEEK